MPKSTRSVHGWLPTIETPARDGFVRIEISQLVEQANQFQTLLDKIKAQLTGIDFPWYPYDTLGNLVHLDALLTGERRYLLDLVDREMVLDIGCADGALSFFLESLGCQVRAVDWPATNYNGLRGIRELKRALGSSVDICARDLDRQFDLPCERYGLVFLLGVLYHVKNPYYLLETLAGHARYCLISSRVARLTPDKQTDFQRLPIGYLLGTGEANQDWTNYWIFSEAGFRRILERTGWEVCDYMSAGNTTDSDPVTSQGDERAFCLAKSRLEGFDFTGRLLHGWHELEPGNWRWTERKFALNAGATAGGRAAFELRFSLPEQIFARLGPLTLRATVNGAPLPAETYSQPGDHVYAQAIDPASLGAANIAIEFELDKALPPSEQDRRELGIIVSSFQIR